MKYDPRALSPDMRENIRFEFCRNPELEPLCWIWTGPFSNRGYGHLASGRVWTTHKMAYRLLVGEVPDGLTLDHLCRIPLCCNPAHLEPVTLQENMHRAAIARKEQKEEREAQAVMELRDRLVCTLRSLGVPCGVTVANALISDGWRLGQ